MDAKFGNFSEMANLLSIKFRVNTDLTVLFSRFALGRMLLHMGMKKEQGYSLVQLIIALCMFRVCGDIHMKGVCRVFSNGQVGLMFSILCILFIFSVYDFFGKRSNLKF